MGSDRERVKCFSSNLFPISTVDLKKKKKQSSSFTVCPSKPFSFKRELKVTIKRQHIQLSVFIKLQALEDDLRAWQECTFRTKIFLNLS